MILQIPRSILQSIHDHAERSYPEEGAGILLGVDAGDRRDVRMILPFDNQFDVGERSRRYLITPENMLQAEQLAEREDLDVVGVFHSHPDHPPRPSDFDLQWALPWYSYLITSVRGGEAEETRGWQLEGDRSRMFEQEINLIQADIEGDE
jgi:proteasome lid subunit RPN8/RPN11